MIKITYEYYCMDYDRQHKLTKTFSDLKDLEDWIFETAIGDVSDCFVLNFPSEENCDPYRISIKLGYKFGHSHHYWIHQIENEKGIIFSDGTYTSKQKHWSKEVIEWCKHCEDKRHNLHYNFVD